MPTDTQPPYRNPQLPISERVADLLARMTLEEKVAQLGATWLNDFIDGEQFVAEKVRSGLPLGIGQIARTGGFNNLPADKVAAFTAALQAVLRQETRLGIPAMIHDESCSGFMLRGAARPVAQR
jgi:beta-glucosidase